jgi:hypothetical protein
MALNGRTLLRKPRLYQSCSAEEEEEEVNPLTPELNPSA